MVFYESSAPTGWTQDTSVNDQVLRTVSGSGGGSGGSNGISGLSTEGHTLSLSEIPSHDHGGGNHMHNVVDSDGRDMLNEAGSNINSGLSRDLGTTGADIKDYANLETANSGTIINSNGGDGSHSHNIDPKYIDVIVATKS